MFFLLFRSLSPLNQAIERLRLGALAAEMKIKTKTWSVDRKRTATAIRNNKRTGAGGCAKANTDYFLNSSTGNGQSFTGSRHILTSNYTRSQDSLSTSYAESLYRQRKKKKNPWIEKNPRHGRQRR